MLATAKSSKPKTLDSILYHGSIYPLHVEPTLIKIRVDDRWLTLEREKIIPNPNSTRIPWLYDEERKVANKNTQNSEMSEFEVTIHIGKETIVYKVKAQSEGKAKNKAVGLHAVKLGVQLPTVFAWLKNPSNSIKVTKT